MTLKYLNDVGAQSQKIRLHCDLGPIDRRPLIFHERAGIYSEAEVLQASNFGVGNVEEVGLMSTGNRDKLGQNMHGNGKGLGWY